MRRIKDYKLPAQQQTTTFVPELKFGGGSTGITYTTQTGTYTQSGKLVFIQIKLVLTSKGSSVGNATIEGLPFIAGATEDTLGNVLAQPLVSATSIVALLQSGLDVIELFKSDGSTNITDGNFQNNTTVNISLTYTV